MCGIFGLIISENLPLSPHRLMATVNHMFKLSESRGKEASGIAVRAGRKIFVFKEPVPASKLIQSKEYKELFNDTVKNASYRNGELEAPIVILGHSRLQTNGLSEFNCNNQPVVKDGAVGIHNGIIVNDSELWEAYPNLKKNYDVDTEVFLSLLQMHRASGQSIEESVRSVFGQIEGSASIAVQFDDADVVVLATNTGSLYMSLSKGGRALVFASERYILEEIISYKSLRNFFSGSVATQVKAGQGFLVNLNSGSTHTFLLKDQETVASLEDSVEPRLEIVELDTRQDEAVSDPARVSA